MANRTIAGFELVEPLAQDGYSTRWRARAEDGSGDATLTEFRKRDIARDITLALREDVALVSAELEHPQILHVGDFGVEDDTYLLIEESCGGYTMQDWVSRKGVLPEADLLVVAENMALAFDFAWQTGNRTHGYLSAGDVIITGDGTIKVAHLGLRRVFQIMRDDPPGPEGEAARLQDVAAMGDLLCAMLLGKAPDFPPAETRDALRKANPAWSRNTRRLLHKMRCAALPGQEPLAWAGVLDALRNPAGADARDTARTYYGPRPTSSFKRAEEVAAVAPAPRRPGGHIRVVRKKRGGDGIAIGTPLPRRPAGAGLTRAAPRQGSGLAGPAVLVAAAIGLYLLWPTLKQRATPRPAAAIQPAPALPEEADPLPEPIPAADTATVAVVDAPLPDAGPEEAPAAAAPPPETALRTWAAPAGVLWHMAVPDGRPLPGGRDEDSGEFSILATNVAVAHVRDARSLPQIIRTNQTFVIHLADLPREPAVLHIALASTLPDTRTRRARPCDYLARSLHVRWNNETLWRRWLAHGHQELTLHLRRDLVEPGDNLLSIMNTGEMPLTFDALWLARPEEGPPMTAAVEGGDTFAPDAAPFLAACLCRLPPPPQSGDAWQRAIRRALDRKLRLVAACPAEGTDADWLRWADQYGPSVAEWLLAGPADAVERVAALIRERAPGASVTREQDIGEAGSAEASEAAEAGIVRQTADYWGNRTDWAPGEVRRRRWQARGEGDHPLPDILWLSAPQTGDDFVLQRKHAGMISEAMMQWWMAGGNRIVIPSRGSRTSFFPSSDTAPAASWLVARALFAFAHGSPRRLPCNVTPREGSSNLADTYWVAAVNTTNLVSVAVMAGELDENRTVDVQLPVPWRGPTLCSIHSCVLRGRQDNPETNVTATLRLNATGPTNEAAAGAFGTVALSFPMSSVNVLRLSRPRIPTGAPSLAAPRARAGAANALPPARDVFKKQDLILPSTAAILLARKPGGRADRLAPQLQCDVSRAWPGKIWVQGGQEGGPSVQSMRIENTVPWTAESDVLLLGPGDDGDGLQPVRLYWNTDVVSSAKTLAFWVRGSQPESSEQAARFAKAFPSRSFLIGTSDGQQRLTVKENDWELFSAPAEAFRTPNGGVAEYLTVWPDPKEKELSLEFNGIIGIDCARAGATSLGPATGRVTLHGDTAMFVMIGGTPGQGCSWHHRFAVPVNITRVEQVLLDDAGAPTLAPVPLDNPALKENNTGPANTRGANVLARYTMDARLLQVRVNAFPPAGAPPLQLPPDHPLQRNLKTFTTQYPGAIVLQLSTER